MRQKPNKYRNTPTEVDGIRFASKAEARRYGELKLLEKAGEIIGLRLQPRFPLHHGDTKICTYVGDFYFWDYAAGTPVCEDVKGCETAAFRIKAKMFRAEYPEIELRIVR